MAVFQIHDKDNVAVAVDRVAKGDTVLVHGQQITHKMTYQLATKWP